MERRERRLEDSRRLTAGMRAAVRRADSTLEAWEGGLQGSGGVNPLGLFVTKDLATVAGVR